MENSDVTKRLQEIMDNLGALEDFQMPDGCPFEPLVKAVINNTPDHVIHEANTLFGKLKTWRNRKSTRLTVFSWFIAKIRGKNPRLLVKE